MQRLVQLIGCLTKSVRSPFAWLLVCLHCSWFLMVIANMSPPSRELAAFLDNGGWSSATLLAGRPFHMTYESIFLKMLFLIDIPALLVSSLFAPVEALIVQTMGFYDASYVVAAQWFVAGSVQWLLVGAALQTRFHRSPAMANLAEGLKRYIPLIIVLVLVCTALAVPRINEGSRDLGFRHGGISFGR